MPAIPPPVHAEKPHDWFKGGHNIREIAIDDGIRDLAQSIAAHGILQPVGAVDHRDYGETVFGFRRLAAYRWGLSEKLALPATIPVRLYPPSLTATQRRIITATENLQRQDPDRPRNYRLSKELMDLNPDWTRKELAAHLNKHPSSITQYLSPDGLFPEALQAFLDGKFGFSHAYTIEKSPDQAKALAEVLHGSSRASLKTRTAAIATATLPSRTPAGPVQDSCGYHRRHRRGGAVHPPGQRPRRRRNAPQRRGEGRPLAPHQDHAGRRRHPRHGDALKREHRPHRRNAAEGGAARSSRRPRPEK